MTIYRHLTNLESPVDDVDGNFLNVLKDYKLGPPLPTQDRDRFTLIMLGIMGVYSTEERLMSKEVQGLTGFDIHTLAPVMLGETYVNFEELLRVYGNKIPREKKRKRKK